MNKLITLAALAATWGLSAHAATIAVPAPATPYAQDFDTLTTVTATPAPAWVNESTLAGWSLFNSTGTAITAYIGGTGSSNSGTFYSFGANNSSERALGGLASGGAYFGSPAAGAIAGYIAVAFTNTSASAYDSFTLNFSGEQWRDGGATVPAAQSMVLQYGFGTSFAAVASWTAPGGSFDYSSPVFVNTGSAFLVDGNVAGRVNGLGGTVTTTWSAGDTLWVRWIERNDVGNDHGLAIDDFSLSAAVAAVPEPQSWALMLGGLAALGFIARRRN
jgi:hypothetical protein